ncbi:MAG TPA: glycosyltransferase family 4 protein [Patescibacteria group bacterium]|nr:glycosyltransferase family 4 protein [Patescibacteria group bacterium]
MKLALFFTRGVSLKTWEGLGSLEREVRVYRNLSNFFEEIYFVSYGGNEELRFQSKLPSNIKILVNRFSLPTWLYSFLLPLLHRRALRTVEIYKTNQIDGAWSATIAKFLFRKKLFLRSGYELLLFLEKEKGRTIKKWFVKKLEKRLFSYADQIAVASEDDREFIHRTFHTPLHKIAYLPNYVDTEVFKPLPVPKRPRRLLFVGRLTEQKNLFNLVEALSNLDVELVMIGRGSFQKELERVAKEKNARVIFVESIPNERLPEEINQAAIFILPSWYEGCPKTLLEAMACGVACIGTNVVGIKSIIQHKVNGYLCETDPASMRKAVIEVMADQTLRDTIGAAARATIINGFSLPKIVEKEKSIYDALFRSNQ